MSQQAIHGGGLVTPLFWSPSLEQVELDEIARHGKDDPMRVTWIGHATMLIQVNILIEILEEEFRLVGVGLGEGGGGVTW